MTFNLLDADIAREEAHLLNRDLVKAPQAVRLRHLLSDEVGVEVF
jgi:hypothetical protein